ncbi:envelope integrity protein Cei [Pseudonocardia phyllosphaerae]|uniref:envelope integrity protein Cei n=1 Tax=Pseudonocardia phyllosphaerae TaxID=3390502 RepID=UPI00397B8425
MPRTTTRDRARGPRPYERRRKLPIALTAVLLAALATVTWVMVFSTASEGTASNECPAPTAGKVAGREVSYGSLDSVPPAGVRDVRFQVLNAGGQRGEGNLVSAQLKDLQFAEAGTPGNDPAYPDGKLECAGQLRFGPSGAAAASTLSLALPCMELIRDERQSSAVDVVVGSGFTDVAPGRASRDVLDQLSAGAGDNGGAKADPGLVSQARKNICSS